MKKIKILIFGILLVLTLQSVFALGITPGRFTLNYPDDLDKVYSFKILNSENEHINVTIGGTGELSDYLMLEETSYEFASSEDSKELKFKLTLEDKDIELEPGEHKGKINVYEVSGYGDDVFGAKLGVSSEIVFFVPYPFKYLESRVEIIESHKNETTVFLIPMINRGIETIENISAVVEIYDNQGKRIDVVNSDSISLKSMMRGDLVIDWKADVPLGSYNAYVVVDYDNEKINFSKDFKVGKISLDIFDLFIEDFELGSIVEMNILVENHWPEQLKEVYANLVLYNESGKIVDITSAPYDIDALSQIRLPLYWDTTNISEGKYNGKLIVRYKEFSSERDLYVDVSKYGIGFELESGSFVFEKENKYIWMILIIIGIFIIILAIINKEIIKNNFKKVTK